jgi:hypothetical protein
MMAFRGMGFSGNGRNPIVARNRQEVSIDAVVGPVGYAYRADANWLWQSASTKLEGTQIELIERI